MEVVKKAIDYVLHPQKKRVYFFNEGSADDKQLLGNKGAGLCEIKRLHLPVPPGFIITTEACIEYYQHHRQISSHLVDQYTHGVHVLEKETGRTFPSCPDASKVGVTEASKDTSTKGITAAGGFPLLLSVRSGAAVSMPGMMDTVLNLGMNDTVLHQLSSCTGNPRFAYDTYRRFLQMYGSVVLGVDKDRYQEILKDIRTRGGKEHDSDLSLSELQQVVHEFKKLASVPEDPWKQLHEALEAVFNSWLSARAISYRDIHNIPGNLGTAITVQSMVYGNMNVNSGSGVAFTRNPSTGENVFFGEYLTNAEGEDVVAGVRDPLPVSQLKNDLPDVYEKLMAAQQKLEKHYRDMQDIEFTVENGHLFILQTRTGKRTPRASVRMAVDMVKEHLLTEREALMRIDPKQMVYFLHPMIDQAALAGDKEPKITDGTPTPVPSATALPLKGGKVGASGKEGCPLVVLTDAAAAAVHRLEVKSALEGSVLGRGLGASTGAACGTLVFTVEAAKKAYELGKYVILCRQETSPEDIVGLRCAAGVLTMRGGMTSHAAVIARGMGKSAVTGACGSGMAIIHPSGTECHYATAEAECQAIEEHSRLVCRLQNDQEVLLKSGDTITLDGASGIVYQGRMPMVAAGRDDDYQTILAWADKYKRLSVLANAETAADVACAVEMGAEGLGLCRTEHMFFAEDRIDLMRGMILASTVEKRREMLNQMLPMQREDFLKIFRLCPGKQVTIRLLDPPLHEFLPSPIGGDMDKYKEEVKALAKLLEMSEDQCHDRIRALSERNPMLGFRGIRLSVIQPEITEMQTKAVVGALFDANQEGLALPRVELMLPLVCTDHEVEVVAPVIKNSAAATVAEVAKASGLTFTYRIGTMLEVPRACLRADAIASEGDISFVSFGTNDLTQLMFGFSRDDAISFLPDYVDRHLLANDPFTSIDVRGVGAIMRTAVQKIRRANPGCKIGVCGEHGGDPKSIRFFDDLGLDYVSCSPYRIPIAKISAAQCHIEAVNREERHQQALMMQRLSYPVMLPTHPYF